MVQLVLLVEISLFFIAFTFATVLSFVVPRRRIWIPVFLCFLMGMISGSLMGEFPSSILPGLFFGVLFNLLIVLGIRWVKYSREKALDRLSYLYKGDKEK